MAISTSQTTYIGVLEITYGFATAVCTLEAVGTPFATPLRGFRGATCTEGALEELEELADVEESESESDEVSDSEELDSESDISLSDSELDSEDVSEDVSEEDVDGACRFKRERPLGRDAAGGLESAVPSLVFDRFLTGPAVSSRRSA